MINFRHGFEDMTEYELQDELSQFLWDDNVHQFLALLNYLYRQGGNAVPFERAILATACRTGAVKCVAALINGNSPLVVDIHSPCDKSLYPLHWAADSGHPGVTELLLYHGAQTNVRCNCSDTNYECAQKDCFLACATRKDRPCYLPLHMALHKIRCSIPIGFFYRECRGIPELLINLSLPIMRNLLETVGLLASKTEETKEEFLHFARNGMVQECATLLVVARKKLLDSVSAVGELVGYLNLCNELGDYDKRMMIDLIYLFHKAGNEIEAYVKKDKVEEKLQVIPEVQCLLQQAGVHAAYI